MGSTITGMEKGIMNSQVLQTQGEGERGGLVVLEREELRRCLRLRFP